MRFHPIFIEINTQQHTNDTLYHLCVAALNVLTIQGRVEMTRSIQLTNN